MSEFFQNGPVLKNQFEDDHLLKSLIEEKIPASIKNEIILGLKRFGDRVISDVLSMARLAEDLAKLVNNITLTDKHRYLTGHVIKFWIT